MLLMLQLSRFACSCIKLLNCRKLQLRTNEIHRLCFTAIQLNWNSIKHYRNLYNSAYLSSVKGDKIDQLELDEKKPEKKKKLKMRYITLLGTDRNDISVMPIDDAEKIAKRRNLKLVKIKDYEAKTERSTYQLMSPADLMKEEIKQKALNSDKKPEKMLTISSKITDNDLKSKLKNILKWIGKKHDVRIMITNDDGEAESVYQKMENEAKDKSRIVQKVVKGAVIKFQILPPKNTPTNADDMEDKSSTVET